MKLYPNLPLETLEDKSENPLIQNKPFTNEPWKNVCHAHSTHKLVDSIERVYIFPRIWSLSPYHKFTDVLDWNLFLPFEFSAHWEKRKLTFFLLWQRKPLIKTFLVCGILLDEGEFFSSHSPKSFANLAASSWNLFYRCFCSLHVVSIDSSFFISFSFLRDFVRNLLINIFFTAACLH